MSKNPSAASALPIKELRQLLLTLRDEVLAARVEAKSEGAAQQQSRADLRGRGLAAQALVIESAEECGKAGLQNGEYGPILWGADATIHALMKWCGQADRSSAAALQRVMNEADRHLMSAGQDLRDLEGLIAKVEKAKQQGE
jgi:hypothetical protein